MNWGSVMASSVSRNMRFLNSRMACPSRPTTPLLFLQIEVGSARCCLGASCDLLLPCVHLLNGRPACFSN